MSIAKGLRLGGLLVAAAILGVVVTLALGHSQAGVSQAGGTPGAMAVDCNASTGGIQTSCQYNPGATFSIQIHVTTAPTSGYFGFQAKPTWTAGVLNYLPNASPAAEALWPLCSIPARADNQPGDPSLVFGCAPFPPPASGSTFTGAVLQFQFNCKSAGGSSPLTLVPRVGDNQGGSHFLDSVGNQIDPTLAGANVNCAFPTPTNTPPPTNTPLPTATPTPCPGGICPTDTPTPVPPTSTPVGTVISGTITPTCVSEIDIVNVLDGSASILSSDFALMQDFAKNLAGHFQIGPAASRVGVVQFSSEGEGKVEIALSDDPSAISAAIDAMVQINGVTDIQEGIALGQGEIAANARANVPHVLIVLTDGAHNEPGDPVAEADAARAAGTELFAVGVTTFADIDELNGIASDPDASHVFQVDQFSDLATVLDAIANAVCGVATPSAFPTTGGGADDGGTSAALWAVIAALLAAAATGLAVYGWRHARSR